MKKKIKPLTFNGIVCITINQYCELMGVSRPTAYARMKPGAANQIQFSTHTDGNTVKRYIHASSLSKEAAGKLDL